MVQKVKSSLIFKKKVYRTLSLNSFRGTSLHFRIILLKLRNMFIKQGKRSYSFYAVTRALNQIWFQKNWAPLPYLLNYLDEYFVSFRFLTTYKSGKAVQIPVSFRLAPRLVFTLKSSINYLKSKNFSDSPEILLTEALLNTGIATQCKRTAVRSALSNRNYLRYRW